MTVRHSVLVPAYQAEATVGRAIDSALAQQDVDVEVVVCDDGSTDGTPRVLAGYGSRITVVRQQNRGLAGARNAALRAATGGIVSLLDADDEWMPSRLARLEAAMADDDVVIATSDADVLAPGQPTTGWYGTHANWVDGAAQRTAILRENFIFGSAAIRRDALEAIGGFDETLPHGSEYEAWVRLLLRGGRAALVLDRLAVYHRRPDALSSADRRGTYRNVLAVLARTEDEFELDVAQRAALQEQRRGKQRWLDTLDALYALAEPGPDARLRLRRAADNPDLPMPKRSLFLAASLAPGLAARAYGAVPERLRPAAGPPPRSP